MVKLWDDNYQTLDKLEDTKHHCNDSWGNVLFVAPTGSHFVTIAKAMGPWGASQVLLGHAWRRRMKNLYEWTKGRNLAVIPAELNSDTTCNQSPKSSRYGVHPSVDKPMQMTWIHIMPRNKATIQSRIGIVMGSFNGHQWTIC